MTFHFHDVADAVQVHLFAVAHTDYLVEAAQDFKAPGEHLGLCQAPSAEIASHSREKMERVDILEDIALPIGENDEPEIIEGLVDIADSRSWIVDDSVLRRRRHKLGERGEKRFEASAWQLAELAGDDRWRSLPQRGPGSGV